MAEEREFEVPIIAPNVIESVKFVNDSWRGVQNREYEHTQPDGSVVKGNTTDYNGFIQERNFIAGNRKITLMDIGDEVRKVERGDNPGPLPPLDLRNRRDGGKGPLRSGDRRKDLVKHLQKILKALQYDLGDTGPDKDGVDGYYRVITQQAVEEFQKSHKDWEGKLLLIDGRVRPRTCDAMNRALVGTWYDSYETPMELTETFKVVTVTEMIIVKDGIEL